MMKIAPLGRGTRGPTSSSCFHALLAEEKSEFNLEDVARGINEKLIRRHPHVFGDDEGKMKTADEVLSRWEKIKAEEKRPKGSSPTNQRFLRIYHHDFQPYFCNGYLQASGKGRYS